MALTQIFKQKELSGKTIERVEYIDNHLFFFFTDSTFTVARGCGWEERDIEIMYEKYNIEPNDWNIEELNELGILSDDDFNRLKFERQNRRDEAQKEKELQQLEELKRKYNS
jgi:hypothetical protein